MFYLGYTVLSLMLISSIYTVIPKSKSKRTIPANVAKELNKIYNKNKTCNISIFIDTKSKTGVLWKVIEIDNNNIETIRKAILNNSWGDILPYDDDLDLNSIKENYFYVATENGLHIDLAK